MTSVSIIRQFYASPRTLIILLPLLEGITDETLPPKSDGFYLRLGKIKDIIRGVPTIKKEILGTVYVGEKIFLWHSRRSQTKNDRRI